MCCFTIQVYDPFESELDETLNDSIETLHPIRSVPSLYLVDPKNTDDDKKVEAVVDNITVEAVLSALQSAVVVKDGQVTVNDGKDPTQEPVLTCSKDGQVLTQGKILSSPPKNKSDTEELAQDDTNTTSERVVFKDDEKKQVLRAADEEQQQSEDDVVRNDDDTTQVDGSTAAEVGKEGRTDEDKININEPATIDHRQSRNWYCQEDKVLTELVYTTCPVSQDGDYLWSLCSPDKPTFATHPTNTQKKFEKIVIQLQGLNLMAKDGEEIERILKENTNVTSSAPNVSSPAPPSAPPLDEDCNTAAAAKAGFFSALFQKGQTSTCSKI